MTKQQDQEYYDPMFRMRIIMTANSRIARGYLNGKLVGVSNEFHIEVERYRTAKRHFRAFQKRWPHVLRMHPHGPEVLEWMIENNNAKHDLFSDRRLGMYIGIADQDVAIHYKLRWL